MGSSGLKARARAGVDRGVLGPSGCRRVGGVNGVFVPRCVVGVRVGDVAGLGVRGWQPALAGRAAPVGEGWRSRSWRSRSGVRGGSIVAEAAGVEAVPRRARRAVRRRAGVKLRSVLAAWQLLLLLIRRTYSLAFYFEYWLESI